MAENNNYDDNTNDIDNADKPSSSPPPPTEYSIPPTRPPLPPSKLSTKDIMIRGTALAAIITIPSILAFLASWYILDDLIFAIVIGGITHFIVMGFSLKLSKKFLKINTQKSDPDFGV